MSDCFENVAFRVLLAVLDALPLGQVRRERWVLRSARVVCRCRAWAEGTGPA